MDTTLVKVGSWSNPRMLIDDGNFLHLQLAKGTCLCATCLSRIEHVERTLSEKEVSYAIVQNLLGDVFALLPLPENGKAKCEHIANLIGLEVAET